MCLTFDSDEERPTMQDVVVSELFGQHMQLLFRAVGADVFLDSHCVLFPKGHAFL